MASALWTYLLCVASAGIYALVWVYRNARDPGGRSRAGAFAWALGSLAAPIACAVLFDIGRSARDELRERGGTSLPVWIAPALYAGLAATLFASPLYALWTPALVLLPIPLAIVHAQIERARRARTAPFTATPARPAWRRRAIEAGVVAVGLPLFGLLAYRLDETGARLLLAPQEVGVVHGRGAPYELTIADLRWTQVEASSVGDDDADLGIRSRDQRSWVVVYVHGADRTIDDVVDLRRQLIGELETLNAFDEERHLLREEEALPVSVARYDVGANRLIRAEYQVVTARLDDALVEVVGFTSNPADDAGALTELVTSLAPSGAGESP